MGVGYEHKLKELAGESAKSGVEIRTGGIVGGMRRGEAAKSCSGVGDDGGDSDKRGVGSIEVGR